MTNIIKREHHFESKGQSYTAYINLDEDMNVVDIERSAISIKNDDSPNEHYDIDGGGEYISIDDCRGSFETDITHLQTILFDKKNNILPFSIDIDEDSYDEEDDKGDIKKEYCNVPCDKLLAAFICFYCDIFDAVSSDFDDEHEVSDNMHGAWDFVIED